MCSMRTVNISHIDQSSAKRVNHTLSQKSATVPVATSCLSLALNTVYDSPPLIVAPVM